jgi:MFS family permease
MELGIAFWIIALCIALASAFFDMQWATYLVFALVGISTAGGLLSDFNMAMEFGPESERPTYMGLARFLTGPALFIAPLLAGWIAQSYGYVIMFFVSLTFSLTGLLILNRLVKDPRFMEPILSLQHLLPVSKNPGTDYMN